MELTPSRVSDFCNEATKLYSLRSPNIVNCMGVAIMPPALCLVTEFCTHGSLFDFLHGEKDYDFINLIEETFKEIYIVKARKKHKVVEALQDLFQPTADREIKPWEECHKDLSTNRHLSVSVEKSRARSYDGSLHEKSALDFQNSLKIGESLRPPSKSLYAANQVPLEDYDGKYGIIEKFKSAASVFRSKVMGFGLGPVDAVKVDDSRSSRRSQISNGNSISQQSVGQLLLSTTESNSFSSKGGAVSTSENSRHRFRSKSLTSVGKGISNRMKIKLAHDCIAGVAFLHSKGLMHCDIKSLNFLVTASLVVKLSDLGEARSSNNLRESEIKLLPVNINWAAPELLRDDYHGVINNKSDIWSLTMVVAEIFSAEVPFDR
jgi:serine/threonine protein kinase